MSDLHRTRASKRTAVAEYEGGNYDRALAAIDEALAACPRDPEGLNLRGAILASIGDMGAALAAFDRALLVAPRFLPALANRGIALLGLVRPMEALDSFDRVIAAGGADREVLLNRGRALAQLGRDAQALLACTQAVELAPDDAEALIARADVHRRAGRLAEALRDLDRVLLHDPHDAEALQNSASILHMRGELEAALARFERLISVLRSQPRATTALDYALGMAISCRRHLCAWEGMEALEALLIGRVLRGASSFNPFLSLMIADDPQFHALCARRDPRARPPVAADAGAGLRASSAVSAARRSHERLRIGYLGGDFRDHPTSRLVAGLIEAHDRARFEIRAYSTSPDDGSAMRRRLVAVFDGFFDVSGIDDAQAAQLITAHETDILVDLSGNTDWSRTGVLARRPAAVCVHFLAYPGPPGNDFIDYFIADAVVLPREQDALYGGAVVRLPHSYQVNDRLLPAPAPAPSRDAAGLPRDGVVYCGFSQPVKLSAAVFDVWMSILDRVPAGVLWLLDAGPSVASNLRAEARARGIDPDRLVTAPRLDHEAHLARLQLADVLLDTWPCGAHTTASDALRAGVPLVTSPGRSFASRVGASVLHAAGLPELIADTLDDYGALAVALGLDAARLAATKQRLATLRPTCPLFDTDLFRRHLEAAYAGIWRRFAAGQPLTSFDVAP